MERGRRLFSSPDRLLFILVGFCELEFPGVRNGMSCYF